MSFNINEIKHYKSSFLMWIPLVCFVSYMFLLRIFPEIFADNVMHHFSINASQYSMLSLYLVGYGIMQIPIGILLDHYGPKYIASFFILLCIISSYIFALTDNWYMVVLSRVLTGIGSSGAFISTTKIISLWFPRSFFSRMVGITVTAGLLGAILGAPLLGYLLKFLHWKSIILIISSAGLLILLQIIITVKNPKHFATRELVIRPVLKELWSILKSGKLITIAILGALMVAPFSSFTDFWVVPFFMQIYGLSKANTTTIISSIYFGFCIGGPLLAHTAEKYNCYKLLISTCAISMFIIMLLFVSITIPYTLVIILSFFLGIFCAYQVLIFALAMDLGPNTLSATIIGLIQTLNMIGAFLYVPAIGILLDKFWDGTVHNGIHIYSKTAYIGAFSIILIALFIAFIGFCIIDTKKQKK